MQGGTAPAPGDADGSDIDNKAERILYRALRNTLDLTEWSVHHGVSGYERRDRGKGSLRWEVDIVLVNRRSSIICIEVKGGRAVTFRGGKWFQGGDQMRKDPLKQSEDGMHALRRRLADVFGHASGPLEAAVGFPESAVSSNQALPQGLDSFRVLDRVDLADLPAWCQRFTEGLGTQVRITDNQFERINELLAPDEDADLRAKRELDADELELNDRSRTHLEFTAEQVEVQAEMDGHTRVAVIGPAGTGKTLLAAHKARLLADSGQRPLLITPQVPVTRMLETSKFPIGLDGVEWRTLAGLALILCEASGIPAPPRPRQLVRTTLLDFHNDLTDMFTKAAAACDVRWDALLIDEAQAIEPRLLTSLIGLLTTKDAPVYLFGDPSQRLGAGAWETPKGYFTYQLRKNCRNSENTGRFVEKSATKVRFTFLNTGGAPPRVRMVPTSDDTTFPFVHLVDAAIEEIQRLFDGGLATAKNTVVLAPGDLDHFARNQLKAAFPGLVTHTIRNFQGCEAPFVVVLLPRGGSDVRYETRYVGISRARSKLVVVADETAFTGEDVDPTLEAATLLLAAERGGRPFTDPVTDEIRIMAMALDEDADLVPKAKRRRRRRR